MTALKLSCRWAAIQWRRSFPPTIQAKSPVHIESLTRGALFASRSFLKPKPERLKPMTENDVWAEYHDERKRKAESRRRRLREPESTLTQSDSEYHNAGIRRFCEAMAKLVNQIAARSMDYPNAPTTDDDIDLTYATLCIKKATRALESYERRRNR